MGKQNVELSFKQNALWNSIGSLTYLGLQWFISIIVTRIVGFEGAGIFSLAMTISGTFYCIASFNIRTYQVSDLDGQFSNKIYISTKAITSFLSIFVCLIFIIINRYDIYSISCILCYMIFKSSEAIADVLNGIDQKHNRMDIVGKSFILRGIISFLSFTIVLYLTKNISISILSMAVSTYMVVFIYDVPNSRKLDTIGLSFDYKEIWTLLVICFPLFLSSILMNSMVNIAKYFLEIYHGKEILGIYSSVAMPTLLVQIASTFVFNPLIGSFAVAYSNRDKNNFRNIFIKCIIVIVAITVICEVGVVLFGDIGLKILFGDKILKYSHLLVPMIISTSLTAMVWFLCMILTVIRSFRYMIVANLLGVLVCVGLSITLIKPYSMDGVNIVTIVSQFIEVLVLAIVIIAEFRKSFE